MKKEYNSPDIELVMFQLPFNCLGGLTPSTEGLGDDAGGGLGGGGTDLPGIDDLGGDDLEP